MEAHWLTEAWRQGQAREDRRAAMAAWVLANVNRDTEHRREPFGLDEVATWLGHGFQPPPPEEVPPTVEELAARFDMLNAAYRSAGG